jgi:hypothetical protein
VLHRLFSIGLQAHFSSLVDFDLQSKPSSAMAAESPADFGHQSKTSSAMAAESPVDFGLQSKTSSALAAESPGPPDKPKHGLRKLKQRVKSVPPPSPHIPVIISSNLQTQQRVFVYFGERNQDLGILAYRVIGGEDGITAGSLISVVKAIQGGAASGTGEEAPAIVIANPGQLIWCRSQGRAMGRTEWENLSRDSAIHPSFRLDEKNNLVEGNRDEAEHVEYVFEHLLKGAGDGAARIDVVGSEWTGVAVVRYLQKHCESKVVHVLCFAEWLLTSERRVSLVISHQRHMSHCTPSWAQRSSSRVTRHQRWQPLYNIFLRILRLSTLPSVCRPRNTARNAGRRTRRVRLQRVCQR